MDNAVRFDLFALADNVIVLVPVVSALLCVQVIYKLIAVPMVGISNPLLVTNLVVVVVQFVALSVLWKSMQKRVADA